MALGEGVGSRCPSGASAAAANIVRAESKITRGPDGATTRIHQATRRARRGGPRSRHATSRHSFDAMPRRSRAPANRATSGCASPCGSPTRCSTHLAAGTLQRRDAGRARGDGDGRAAGVRAPGGGRTTARRHRAVARAAARTRRRRARARAPTRARARRACAARPIPRRPTSSISPAGASRSSTRPSSATRSFARRRELLEKLDARRAADSPTRFARRGRFSRRSTTGSCSAPWSKRRSVSWASRGTGCASTTPSASTSSGTRATACMATDRAPLRLLQQLRHPPDAARRAARDVARTHGVEVDRADAVFARPTICRDPGAADLPGGSFPPVGRSLAYRCGAFQLLGADGAARAICRRAAPARCAAR